MQIFIGCVALTMKRANLMQVCRLNQSHIKRACYAGTERKGAAMTRDMQTLIDEYLAANWETMLADYAALIEIPSVEDLDAATPGAPFGPEPARALDAALGIAARMGLEAHNCEGYIGVADLPGASPAQIGIIGHVDVVPAGPGWHFEPYALTRKDGYLVGRGIIDDKGPIITALHAVNLFKQNGIELPYTLRMMFGANEETNMKDVKYYLEHYEEPAFLFTPDAEFPVSYGEAGIMGGLFTSKRITDGVIVDIAGGVAMNAVPGEAHAVVRARAADLASKDAHITVTDAGADADGRPLARIDVAGKSAHASTPELGVSAIRVLVDYLLMNDLCSYEEKQFLMLERAFLRATNGEGLNIACSDEHFGALTAVGGIIAMKDGCITQTLDARYPTCTSADAIAAEIRVYTDIIDATFEVLYDKKPFLLDKQSPAVEALLAAYREATGEAGAEPFTMKGGTYARCFKNAASFGPEKPWVAMPEWAGGMHGPDETASEESLKEAFRIYALTIDKLMELEW